MMFWLIIGLIAWAAITFVAIAMGKTAAKPWPRKDDK